MTMRDLSTTGRPLALLGLVTVMLHPIPDGPDPR